MRRRQHFATALAALGAGVVVVVLALTGCASMPGSAAPGSESLVGRWVPSAEGASPDAFVEFADDGTLELSDGCNGAQGQWTLDAGVFSATTGPHTQMFCDGYVPVHSWLDGTESIELTDGVLVLKDSAGAQLGELSRP